MKKIGFKLIRFCVALLVIFFIMMMSAPTASAEDKAAPQGADQSSQDDPCHVKLEGNQSIPDTFSVGDCLTTKDQRGSLFVPKKNPKTGENLVQSVLTRAISLFLKIIASIALIVFIIGALLAISSEGKSDRLEKGKTAMIYAVIGLVIAFMSFIIVSFVQSVFF